MPIGSRTRGTTTGLTPNARNIVLTLSPKKFAYLKTPSTARLIPTATPTSSRARRSRSGGVSGGSAGAVHSDRHPIVERDRGEHQPGERAAALRVKDHARNEEQPVRIGRVNATNEVQREENG